MNKMKIEEEEVAYWLRELNEFLAAELNEEAANLAGRMVTNLVTHSICFGQERGKEKEENR